MEQEIYKIRHKTTGLFSKGGMGPRVEWSKTGKIWKRKGDLSSHLSQFADGGAHTYRDAEVIKIVITEAITEVVDASVWTDAARDRLNKKQELVNQRHADYLRQRDLTELERLKRKYGQ